MSETETRKTVGIDGLIEFGEYLATLADASYRHYTFEMPDETGRLRECSLDDALAQYQEYCARKSDEFRLSICYVDYQQGTMGRSDRIFTRLRQ